MTFRMRMLSTHRRRLQTLLADTSKEQACFLLCEEAQGADETILLVKEVIGLRPEDLQVQAPDQLRVNPAAMLQIARSAQRSGVSICMVHTHPMCDGEVDFSLADDFGNRRTFEFFFRLVPNQFHSCLVWDGPLKTVQGRVYKPDGTWNQLSRLEVINDDRWKSYGSFQEGEPLEVQFERQARLLGKDGQQKLSKFKIGIVGCGGIGSVAASLLVHSGIREFLLIDFDIIEQSNLPRILGAVPDDVKYGNSKVDVVKRYIESHAPNSKILTYRLPVENPALLPELISLDAVICGTDDTTSRGYLNQLCHQYFVPVLDLGVQFAINPSTGTLEKEIGRANLILPATPCMVCTQHVDAQRLADEGLPPVDRERKRKAGYLTGAEVEEPSMMLFNMQVVSRGIQHLISWITGLRAQSIEIYDQFHFLGLNKESGIWKAKKRSTPSCIFCNSDSQYLGAGSKEKMLVKPRLSRF